MSFLRIMAFASALSYATETKAGTVQYGIKFLSTREMYAKGIADGYDYMEKTRRGSCWVPSLTSIMISTREMCFQALLDTV